MMESEWPSACFVEDVKKTRQVHEQLFGQKRTQQSVTLLLKGTNFQIKVWETLLRIPIGSISTYENIAALAGKLPSATRACASAIACNIGWLIPCHRVVRKLEKVANTAGDPRVRSLCWLTKQSIHEQL